MLWTHSVRRLFTELHSLVTSRPVSCCWATVPTPPSYLCRDLPPLRWAMKPVQQILNGNQSQCTFFFFKHGSILLSVRMNLWNFLLLNQFLFFFFLCSENVPTRNSDVDYRFLEAAKAGDLDTVQVSPLCFRQLFHLFREYFHLPTLAAKLLSQDCNRIIISHSSLIFTPVAAD